MRRAQKLAALVVLAVMLVGLLLPTVVRAEQVTVPIPDVGVQPGSGADATQVTRVFNELTKYALILSGGVIALVLMVIGYMFATISDPKRRAEVMDWLKWVIVGAGITFGGTFITRVLVSLYTKAFS